MIELKSTRRAFLGGFAALAAWPENLWGAGAPQMPSLRRSVWERSDGNATDSVMVRRLYLDLAGRIPRADGAKEFVNLTFIRLAGTDYDRNVVVFEVSIYPLPDTNKYYYHGTEVLIMNSTANGYEVWTPIDGNVHFAFKENRKATIPLSKEATYIPNGLSGRYSLTKDLYQNGKETSTITCMFGDYYDYLNSTNKEIAIDNSTGKMMFEVGDKVVPMISNISGEDTPMSSNADGTPKIFEVLGIECQYEGQPLQILSLQESDGDSGLQRLLSPKLSIDGDLLTLTPTDENATEYAIFIDGKEVTVLKPNR